MGDQNRPTGFVANSKPPEIINEDFSRGHFRAALFDFDGTVSLLRRNWQDVMIPMMVNELLKTRPADSTDQLKAVVEDFVMKLTGRQTIYQMMQLCEEIRRRGGVPAEPLEYKRRYHALLWKDVKERVESVKQGKTPRHEFLVPECEQFLAYLARCGLTLYLASGTDLEFVQNELEVLGLSAYFGPRVYGALDDYQKFSKAMLIEQIIRETSVQPQQLLAFGDGFVEIEEVKRADGVAVGVASNEVERMGVDPRKRSRLISAGADVIVSDFRCWLDLARILEIQPDE